MNAKTENLNHRRLLKIALDQAAAAREAAGTANIAAQRAVIKTPDGDPAKAALVAAYRATSAALARADKAERDAQDALEQNCLAGYEIGMRERAQNAA